MGQCGGHLGSIPYRRLPSRPSGKASPETSWKTPASVATSRQEPLTGGGALSRTQPLWLPPITTRGNLHLSINSPTDFISHIPRTWDWLPVQVSLIDSSLFKLLSHWTPCEVLFCYATISERFFRVWFPVYDLDCLLDSESPPPAYFNHICLVYWLPRVFAASPDH